MSNELTHIDLTNTLSANAQDVTAKHGWKCNNCQTVFTSAQQERKPDDNNGGPVCPACKAHGQYTYPFALHDGDPCTGCGIAHDDVAPGACSLRLTAAAPDLLAVALWFIAALEGAATNYDELVSATRAAIAKATAS